MKIVATGATSFVGRAVVQELLRRGHTVVAVLRENSSRHDLLKVDGEFPSNLIIMEKDLGSLNELPGDMAKAGYEPSADVFIQMGWRGAGSDSRKRPEIQEESVGDALAAIHAAKELGCRRFIFTGSQAEYGVHSTLMDENTECRPTSPYGEAKLKVRYEAEAKCRELGLDFGHVRIFSTYGPGDHPWSLISTLTKTLLEGGEMSLSACTQKWNFVYIDDAGRAIASLAECQCEGGLLAAGPVFNLGGPMDETAPLREFVEKVYKLCGEKGSLHYGVMNPNAEGVVNLIPDISRLSALTGWQPEVRFEEGIKRLLKTME